ncbi:hypothetical protein FHS31_002882 [Sphingomonas vulcanisoli]|uniref:Uncharacterized protein n=2 Tax=Sphingomonas vulcanisoli TaxID=1658060 RepID=A0ABX0TZS4_9SPHN|nr:hypothetical protein [Sphingomonas vulcanisoli]
MSGIAGNLRALLGQRVAARDQVAAAGAFKRIAMKIVQIHRDAVAVNIVPWPLADAIARIDRGRTGARSHTQISPPRPSAQTGRSSKFLAMSVGTFNTPKIAAMAQADTADEE